ncbi:Blue-light photoreceptor PHR2 [Porphyridium purpureum]|uniref:Blue-light photoreceptor PHR2 n=1 Tax=Porphyridium purpureum TaxID=35688 RepID=A0A5J4YU15_PORPP|nr:Blue-light photoreceptor PHR2 [Porphyridium purpureum]|eukprot:POR8731..scf227_4
MAFVVSGSAPISRTSTRVLCSPPSAASLGSLRNGMSFMSMNTLDSSHSATANAARPASGAKLQLDLVRLPYTGHRMRAPAAVPSGVNRVLVWFQADLRVQDNEALNEAVNRCAVPGGAFVPVYASSNHTTDRLNAAQELKSEMQKAGSDLIAVHSSSAADTANALLELVSAEHLQAVFLNFATSDRDADEQQRVISSLEEAGVQAFGFWSNALCDVSRIETAENEQLSLIALRKETAEANAIAKPIEAKRAMPKLPTPVYDYNTLELAAIHGRGTSRALAQLQSLDKESQTLNVRGLKGADLVLALKGALDCGSLSAKMVHSHIVTVMGEARGYLFNEIAFRTFTCGILRSKMASSVKTLV